MLFDGDYKYIDHEYLYTDKDTGVLLNKQNIKDSKELIAFESLCVANRSEKSTDKTSIAKKLAEILDNVNFLHPFREGNGRTQREFIRLLAGQKGYDLDLNPIDNHSVYERYMDDTINGKVDDLTDLICELLK